MLVVTLVVISILFDPLAKWCGIAALLCALLYSVVPSSVWEEREINKESK